MADIILPKPNAGSITQGVNFSIYLYQNFTFYDIFLNLRDFFEKFFLYFHHLTIDLNLLRAILDIFI